MTGLYVNPTDLRAKATQIRGLQFTNSVIDKPVVGPPDLLPSSKPAVANLNENASALYRYQDTGRREGLRLAETLDSVAQAYEDVDAQSHASIEGNDTAPKPVVPKGNSIPAPTPPEPMGALQQVSAGGFILVDKTQSDLSTGDNAASLQQAAEKWISTGNALHDSAGKMKEPVQNWEGDAARQAYDTFNKFGEWLYELGTAWHKLGGEAFELAEAHRRAMWAHTPIYQQYKKLEAACEAAVQSGASRHVIEQYADAMMRLQQNSDDLREAYARASARQTVTAPDPPAGGAPTSPVTQNGTPPRNGGAGGGSAGGAGGGAGGGGKPASSNSGTAQTSPMSADPSQQSKGGESGGEQSGGGLSGGESGGGSGGGEPGAPTVGDPSTEMPDTTGDPRLSPAADTGAGGGGSGGGGSGGGAGAAPLQPSVSGVAVGPAPSAGGGTAGTAAPAAAASGGGMMGGMGGMPMGGGQGAPTGTEKKRSPGLSPDEDLYTEDRPHTEGIIGRPERRAGQGKRDST